MKISNEVKLIEDFLLGKLTISSRLLFEARLILDPTLRGRVEAQRKLYSLIRQSGRRKIGSEIEKIHHVLFTAPEHETFRKQVHQLFQKK
jgi:hypothetical protein